MKLPAGVDWKPMHVVRDIEEPIDLGVEVAMTDELPAARAREVYRAAAAAGTTALLVTAGSFEYLDVEVAVDASLAQLVATQVGTVFPAKAMREIGGACEAALEQLAAVWDAGFDVLHRLDQDTLAAIEGGDEVEVDDDMLVEDDVAAAYAAELASRLALRAQAQGGMMLVSQIRTYDLDTTLAQLAIGPAHVIALATDPARALLHLSYGGWNACPGPHVHARAWLHWAETIGAIPIGIDGASLYGFATRPPVTRADVVRFAAEVAIYDPDMTSEGMLALLGKVARNASLAFWWD